MFLVSHKMHRHLRRIQVAWRDDDVIVHLVAHAEHVLMESVLLHLNRQMTGRDERLEPLFELQEKVGRTA